MKKLLKISAGIPAFFLLAALVLYLMTLGTYKIPDTVTDDQSLPRISAGNRIFHGETFGIQSNPPVIVLHGGPGGDYQNLLALEGLADRFFVVFYDQAGSGLSPRQERGTINLDSSLKDLDLIVEKFRGGRPVALIGHSWGAMLASAYTGKHPDKVGRLVLVEPGFLTPEKGHEFLFKTRPPMTPGALWFLVKTWFESRHIPDRTGHKRYDYIMAQMVTGFDSPDHPLSGYFCNREASGAAKNFQRFGFTAWEDLITSGVDGKGGFTLSFVTGIDSFNKKVLFLTGECNVLIGTEYQEDHRKLFRKTEAAVIPHAGHLMLSENPVAAIKVIRAYLR